MICPSRLVSAAPVVLLWVLATLFATTTTTTALMLPPPLPSATSINLNVNAPAIIDSVRTKESRAATLERANFLSQSVKFLLGPENVSVDGPTDLKAFVKQALQGQASVTVNTGLEKLPPQQLDVQVLASDWGALTVQIRNPLLPKLPLLLPNDTPDYVSNVVTPVVSETVSAVVPIAQRMLDKAGDESPPSPPFWTTPIREGTLTLYGGHAITLLDIVGSTSLALGVAYGKSYDYYVEQQELETRAAEERKKTAAAKRTQKAAAEASTAAPAPKKKKPANKKKPTVEKKKSVDKPKTEKKSTEKASPTKVDNPKTEKKSTEKASPTKVDKPKTEKKSTEKTSLTKVKAEASAKEPTSPAKNTTATAVPAVALPSGPQQLERSVTSIALPKKNELPSDDEDDDQVVKPKNKKKKKKGFGFLRIFTKLFRKK